MEEKFFSYKIMDRLNELEYMYNDIVLNMDIGIFKKGRKLKFSIIDFSIGKLYLENEEYDIELILKEEEKEDE